MTGEVTTPPRHAAGGLVRDVGLVVGMFAVGGLVGAGVWRWAWTPFRGTVLNGVWYPQTNASAFSATGLFVVIGLGIGVVLGVLSALLTDRRELLTLGLVLGSALLAAWIMLKVGQLGMPADPSRLARNAPDRSQLPATLTVRGLTPLVAFPTGALLGLCSVFVGIARKPRDRPPSDGSER